MHRKTHPVTLFFTIILAAALLGTACSTATSPAGTQSENPQVTNNGTPGEDVPPGEEAPPADAPQSPSQPGATRQNPIPLGQLVSTPGWDVQVQEFYRGDQALEVLRQDKPDISPPPEGSEYAVASVYIRCTSLDENPHSISLSDMYMTGDQLGTHTDEFDELPAPEFLYKDLYTAETFTGWVDGIIPTTEHNKILVFDPVYGTDAAPPYYFALEEGASIAIPAGFQEMQPTQAGQDPTAPLPLGDTAVTEDWQVSVLEVVRGDEVLSAVKDTSAMNEPLEEGMEYILVRLGLNFISTEDRPVSLSEQAFRSRDQTGNEVWQSGVYTPKPWTRPWVYRTLFPGAQVNGWAVIKAPINDSGVTLVFDPDVNSPEDSRENIRYLALEP
jgi:hypothetical protein